MSAATGADIRIPHPHLQWRGQRGDEVKLSNRANVFAKARALEKAIHQNSCHKVRNDNPCRPPRRFPEVKKLIRAKEAHQ